MGTQGQQLALLLQQHQRGRPQRRRWARQRRVRAAEASALSAARGSSYDMSFAIQICARYRIGWVDQNSIIENKFDCNTPGTGEKARSNGDFEPIMLA